MEIEVFLSVQLQMKTKFKVIAVIFLPIPPLYYKKTANRVKLNLLCDISIASLQAIQSDAVLVPLCK